MGGPFSAQSADLHSVWEAKKHVGLMPCLGQLTFSPRRHPLWLTPRGNTISLAQFCDNVLVGARGPPATSEMQHVCSLLSNVWNLLVLCECMTEKVSRFRETREPARHGKNTAAVLLQHIHIWRQGGTVLRPLCTSTTDDYS